MYEHEWLPTQLGHCLMIRLLMKGEGSSLSSEGLHLLAKFRNKKGAYFSNTCGRPKLFRGFLVHVIKDSLQMTEYVFIYGATTTTKYKPHLKPSMLVFAYD